MPSPSPLETYFGGAFVVRLLLQRGVAAIYCLAYLNVLNQFKPLLGERGLLPVSAHLERVRFRDAPSVFHFRYSDRLLDAVAWTGLALSLFALTGLSERGPWWLSLAVWLALYVLYLSIVNVGQTFYGFGWESMLLEAGFFAAFLGPAGLRPSLVPVLALRWMLFRVELGAGLIKLRHDRCWRDLTCLYFHYETQPLPNPLSRTFHHFPRPFQRASVAFSHFVQLVVPFGLFAPQPVASVAGALLCVHQLLLVVSGNYAWLNWLTIVLGFSAFGDGTLAAVLPCVHSAGASAASRPFALELLLDVLAGATLLLSVKPALNLVSKRQAMNATYNSLHLVGSYGAFGSVTRERYEIVVEGSADTALTDATAFREYEFKGKPGDPRRRPRPWAPYHLRLDWLMWFLPLRLRNKRPGFVPLGYELWFMRLIEKLLEGDRRLLSLLHENPFPDEPPRFVRASLYRYEFTTRDERASSGLVWKRTRVGDYLGPVSRH
ncbi:MAG TPA: lipase maturation factor family protein [Polyangiaceae bacterium]|nr:lipase maturation factor family protein [Polyangiaceae bacterium]